MITTEATTSTTDRMREVLAFALNTADEAGIPIYSVRVHAHGDDLDVWVDGKDDRESVDRLAVALGVTDRIVFDSDTTYAVRSRGCWSAWEQDKVRAGEIYPYSGASVPFGDRLIEVSVICSLSD